MRTRTATWKECIVQFEKTTEDGTQKKVKETYVVDGLTFTEEMMGFPFLWTALPFLSASGAPKPSKPTATPSCPK